MPSTPSAAQIAARKEKLMPLGIPRWIRLYDNEGASFDRYTAVFTGKYKKDHGEFFYRGMSRDPYHPQGFGICDSRPYQIDLVNGWPPKMGGRNHLGKRIPFSELPPDCQKCVVDDYKSLWNIKE